MPNKFCGDCSMKLGMFKRKLKQALKAKSELLEAVMNANTLCCEEWCSDTFFYSSLKNKTVQCSFCRNHYCSPCFSKVKQNEVELQNKLLKMIGNNCLSCVVLNESIKREQLDLLGIRQLTKYLNLKNISTVHCKEKYHLIDLIMEYATANGFVSGSEVEKVVQHDMEVQRLRQAEFLRREQEKAGSSTNNDDEEENIHEITEQSRPSSSFIQVRESPRTPPTRQENHVNETVSATNSSTSQTNIELNDDNQTEDVEHRDQEEIPPPDVLINISSDEEQGISNHRSGYSSQYLFSPSPSTSTSPTNMDKRPTRKWKSFEDIKRESDIAVLTVIELKQILTANFIGFKGCCEKRELIEKVKMLYSSEKKNETDTDSQEGSNYDKDICKICMDSVINCVLLDCGHLVACTKCGKRLAECPVCRALVVRVVHIFRV